MGWGQAPRAGGRGVLGEVRSGEATSRSVPGRRARVCEEELGKWSGEMRRRSQRRAAAGPLGAWWRAGAARKRAPRGCYGQQPSKPPPGAAVSLPGSGRPTLQSLLPSALGLWFPPPAVAEFRSSPGRPCRDRRAQGPLPPHPPPGGRGAHLGAGAGPAHRPEQQQRQAERAGGAGHGGALRTGPSLPPAEPRAATDPERPAAPGEEPARGRPARGRGRRGPASPGRAAQDPYPSRPRRAPVGPRPGAPGAALAASAARAEAAQEPAPHPLPTPAPRTPGLWRASTYSGYPRGN